MSVQVYGVTSDTTPAQVQVYGVTADVPAPPSAGEYVWTGGSWVLAPAYVYLDGVWTKASMSTT